METPKDLNPVLAKIESYSDLGRCEWYEVVYFDDANDNNWKSYSGSDTFNNGERVLQWKYVDKCL